MAATNKTFSLKTVLSCQDGLSDKLKTVQKNLRSLDRAFDKVSRSASDVAHKAFAPLLALGGAGLFSVSSSVRTFIELGDAIDKAAQRAGVGTSALQKLRFAAKLSGMDAEEMDHALSKLSGEMGKAAAGDNKKLVTLFSSLGISWKDAKGQIKDSATVFRELSEAIRVNQSPAARLQILTDVFGDKLAARLVPLMKDGAAGLDEMARKAEQLGVVVSSDDVKAASELGDTLDIFRMSLSTLQTTIGARLAPVITRVVEKLEDVIGRNRELISQRITQAVEAFSEALESVPWDTVISAISAVLGAVGWLFNALGGVKSVLVVLAGVGIGKFVMSVVHLMTALNALRVAFMAAFGLPGLLIAGAVAAVAFLATKIYEHWDEITAKAQEVYGAVVSAINRAGQRLSELASRVKSVFIALTEPIRSAWESLTGIVSAVVDWIEDKIGSLSRLAPDWLKNLVGFSPSSMSVASPMTVPPMVSPAGVGSMRISVTAEGGAKARIDELDARNMNISADARSYDPGESF